MNKKEALQLGDRLGWKKADAKRALESINFNTNPSEVAILETFCRFAGTELDKRQRLQAARKGMVTKKNREIERKDKEYAAKIGQYEEYLKKEISLWREVVGSVYRYAQRFGLKDPMIEHILKEDSDEDKVARA